MKHLNNTLNFFSYFKLYHQITKINEIIFEEKEFNLCPEICVYSRNVSDYASFLLSGIHSNKDKIHIFNYSAQFQRLLKIKKSVHSNINLN